MRFADRARAIWPGKHDPLVETPQMRRNERMRPVARRLQHGLQKGDGRALPVRPRYVDNRRKPALRVSQRLEQALDPAQRKVDALRVEVFEPCQQMSTFFRLQR